MTSVQGKRIASLGVFFILSTALIYLLRHHLPVVMLQLLVLTAVMLGLVTVPRSLFLRNVLFLAGVLFFGLGTAELYFHNFDPNRAKNRGATWEGSFITDNFFRAGGDPDLGYGITPAKRTYQSIKRRADGQVIYHAHYSITSNGLRETPAVDGPVAYFFGCSVTMGVGVDDEDTLPDQFSRMSGYHAINFGVLGYGTHHVMRALEIDRPASLGLPRPDIVIYTAILDHMNRAADRGVGWDDYGPRCDVNAVYQGPFHARNATPTFAERLDHILRFWWRTYSAVRTQMDINYYQRARTPEERKRFISLVVKARDIVKQRYGVPFVVVFWDTMENGKTSQIESDWVTKTLRTNDIDVLQLSKVKPDSADPQYYIAGDAHPNRKGHTLVATELTHWVAQLPQRPQVAHDD
jgi:hypothetical protein